MASNKLRSRVLSLAAIVGGCVLAGTASAHPGHDHGSWVANIIHLAQALAPLLALLMVGVGGAMTYRVIDRER